REGDRLWQGTKSRRGAWSPGMSRARPCSTTKHFAPGPTAGAGSRPTGGTTRPHDTRRDMSKNEIIGALTVERDKAVEARDKALKERDEAREQVRRIEKRDRLSKELADLDKEIAKHAVRDPFT